MHIGHTGENAVRFLLGFSLLVLISLVNNTDSVFAYSLEVTTSGEVTMDIAPPISGDIGTAVAIDNVGIVSDCRAGYNFVITGPNDNNLYLDGDDSNNTSGSFFTTVNGTGALNSVGNINKWGYSLTANNGLGVFAALSNESVVLKTTLQTASPDSDIDTILPIYYGVSTNYSMLPGSYSFANEGYINYQVVMDTTCIPGIHYMPNGADGGLDTMEIQNVAAGANAYLVAPNYSREGYGFASWNTQPDGSGTNYGPNEYITMPDSGVLILYANWVASSGDLQGWMGCPNLSMYDVIGLTDTRDGNVYAVAKLADGKCWMVENLRLDLAEADINELNTNNPKKEFLTKLEDTTPNNGEWCVRTEPEATQSPCEKVINYNTENINREMEAVYTGNEIANVSWYSYGVMYNNYAATAGGGSGGGDVSICPNGWKLPTGATRNGGSTSQDFHGLMYSWDNNYVAASFVSSNGINSNLALAYPNNFVVSGVYRITTFRSRGIVVPSGSIGPQTNYWATGGYMSGVGNSLRFTNYRGPLLKVEDFTLTAGGSVRCVVNDNLEDFTLSYNTNGGDTAIPSVTVSANKVHTFTISSTVPQRSGYSFKYWMYKDGTTYDPGDAFTTIDTDAVLYAIWENNSCNPNATTIGNAVCLQDMNDEVKSTMVSKQVYTLKDERDNKEYDIALLDDGMVWMTDNLDLGSSSEMMLLPDDTDITGLFVLPAQTDSFNTGSGYNTVAQLMAGTQYGSYYSYSAAIARERYSGTNQVFKTSICPAGWDLPLDSHYKALVSAAGINSYNLAKLSPYSFVLGGYISSSTPVSVGSYGRYWTSVVGNSSNYATSAQLSNSSFSYNSNYKYYGFSVRCIASNGNGTVHYNANGGSGSMDSRVNEEMNVMKADANSFDAPNDHKQFREWNTRADGSGMVVKSGDAITKIKDSFVDGEVTLYAQWDDLYIVTFHNTDTGESEERKAIVGNSLYSYSVSTWENNREYYECIGWDTNSSGQNVVYGRSYITPTSDMDLYTVWSPLYVVAFDGNGADSGSMSSTDKLRVNTSVTPGVSNFERVGYGFAGWSMNSAAEPGDGVSTIYGPEQSIVLSSNLPAGVITLYAIWLEADTSYTMQLFASNGVCSTMSIGDTIALTDTRDSNVYVVAKLVDGGCWMTENLRLDPTQAIISSQNTDEPTADFISELANYPSVYDGCSDDSDPDCVNSVGFSVSDTFEEGVSYNWYTATAGNGTYAVTGDNVALGSICPSGWYLPRGAYWGDGIEGEVDRLRPLLYGGGSWQGFSPPNNFLMNYYWTSSTSFTIGSGAAISFEGRDGYSDYSSKTYYNYVRCMTEEKEYTFEFTSNYYSYSGSISDITNIEVGDVVALPSSGFAFDSDYIFEGWLLEEEVSGDYNINDVIPVGSSITVDRGFASKIPIDGTVTFYPALRYNG